MNEMTTLQLRGKILGALIRDARLKAEKPIEKTASLIGKSSEDYERYELGTQAISLPELEVLAPYLSITVERLLEKKMTNIVETSAPKGDASARIVLRQRIVGAKLRQKRLENELSFDDLSNQSGIDRQDIEAYELGLEPIPIPVLERICSYLNITTNDLVDQKLADGETSDLRRAFKEFQELPPELQAFVLQPANRPFLNLAMKLCEFPVDRLRAIAEGLLEITH